MTRQDKFWLIYAGIVAMRCHPKNHQHLDQITDDEIETAALTATSALEIGERQWPGSDPQ